MAKVAFKSAKFQKQLQQEIADRVLKDLRTESKPTSKAYLKHVREVGDDLVKGVAKRTEQMARQRYIASLDTVGQALSTGIRGSVNNNTLRARKRFKGITLDSWQALSRKYFVHKRKFFAENSSSFWKRSGKLSAAYNSFSSGYSGRVGRSKHKSKLLDTRFKNQRVRLRYRTDFTIPSPTRGGQFFDAIFLRSFFDEREYSLAGQPAGGGLDVIGYLEGVGDSPRHRPFISRLMASRGGKFNKDLVRMLNGFTSSNKVF